MSVLSVDATHNNPVLNVFIYLLSWEVQQSSFRQELQHSSGKHSYYSYCHLFILFVTVAVATVIKLTDTKYYTDVGSLNTPLVQSVSYDNSKVNISRAKKWWYLAYTLIRNPDLIELRKRGGMEMKVDQDVSQSDLI